MDPKPEAPDEEVGDNDLLEEMPVQQRSQSAPSMAPSTTVGRIRSKICDVRGCTSNSLRNPELLFVAVPGQNAPERRFVWLTLMQAVRDKKRSYVCSRHFAVPDDFKDFEEYISAPPGYKRQLLVKRGVVPHFNMPPLNMPGLPPLNDRWQLTLPVGMTETDQLRQARVTAMFSGGVGHLQGPIETSAVSSNRPAVVANQQTSAVQRAAKSVQTETIFSSGQRKMQPSLQYCRLCLQRQDLEPIFTGDQTLIEPDLIDKIYGCTQILITVENDFPSSICTNCYQNVQHFITFRRSVQKNDQSLRSTAATVGTFKPAPCPPLPAPTTARSSPSITQPLRTKTVGKVTPMRPVPSPAAPVRTSLASPQCPGIVPLAPWSTARTHPTNQQEAHRPDHRTYAPQRTVIRPLPMDQSSPKESAGNQSDIDPFANVEESSSAGWDNQQDGVQMGDRVVPVTLIRVQPEQEAQEYSEEEEEEEEDVVEVPEEPEKKPEEDNSRRNFLQPKPLEKLLENARKTAPESEEPEVLQAVQLIPSAVAQEVVKQQKAPKIFLRKAPVPSKRLGPVPTLSKVKEAPKFSTVPKVVRGVKFPGTLTTLFSGARKTSKVTPKLSKSTASPELTKYKAVSSPKPVETSKPETPAQEKPKPAPPPKPKAPIPTAQVLKEVKVSEEPAKQSPRPKAPPPTTKPKQKENDVPESPKSAPDLTSPRSARARKIPAKFQDTVGFPMPKVEVKADPDAPATKELPEVKSVSELPELRVRVQDARTRLSVVKPEVSPASKTRLSGGKPQTPPVTKEPGKKVQAVKVSKPPVTKEPEKKVQATKVKTPTVSKEPEKKVIKVQTPTVTKEPEKKIVKVQTPTVAKEPERKMQASKVKPKDPVKIVTKANEAKSTPVQPTKTSRTPSVQIAVKLKDARARLSKEAPPEEPTARPTKRKSVPDEKESPRAKRTSLETPKAPKPNGSRQSAPAKPSPAPAPATPAAVAPRASACPFCSNRTFEDKKALVKHLRKRHGMDYATVRQRLAIYGGNW